MLTEMLFVSLVIAVVLPLVAFAIGLLVLGLYELTRAAFASLGRFVSDSYGERNFTARIDEVRSIGEQTRRELEQLSFDFLYTISNHKRR